MADNRIVFLSHPITDYISAAGGYRPDRKDIVKNVIAAIKGSGSCLVECAALNEDYGKIRLTPEEFTAYDVAALNRCTEFALFSTLRPTADMYLELGIALARKVQCAIFLPSGARVTYMVEALADTESIDLMRFEREKDLPVIVSEYYRARFQDQEEA